MIEQIIRSERLEEVLKENCIEIEPSLLQDFESIVLEDVHDIKDKYNISDFELPKKVNFILLNFSKSIIKNLCKNDFECNVDNSKKIDYNSFNFKRGGDS